MKKIFYIIFAISLLHQCVGAQWVQQNSGTTQHLTDISMINKDTGWVCGENGTILYTTNAGLNWLPQVSGLTDRLETMFFVNSLTGFAATRVTGKVIKTTNGGTNWDLIFHTNTASFNSIFFIDSLYGWIAAVGLTNQCYSTTTGGNSWDSVTIYPAIGRHIQFIDKLTGWINIGPLFYKTTNSGKNWFQTYSSSSGEIAEFLFNDTISGWLVTSSYKTFTTTDGGFNWILNETLPACANAHSIFFTNPVTGWVSGDCGYLYSTTNNGTNWYRQNTNTNSFLKTVHFENDTTGWCVGGAGTILYTSNGGAILGINNGESEIPKQFKLYQNYPNPFNPQTTIEINVPIEDNIKIIVYDVLGKEMSIIADERLKAGKYKFEFNGSNISSGKYFCTLYYSKGKITKKMILNK